VFTLGNSKSRRPLVLQDIKTNGAIAVDIGMIDFGGKVNLNDAVCGQKMFHFFLYVYIYIYIYFNLPLVV
jgi:hypothetical protein